ncbi:sulfur carrier protein ThiS [Glaciimonas soli]|uniref:Sulfur carrier protein ThiS n=1 Tax=Glaciimonas soli TaxID=2590999 RepID=A0A843YW29_9BURK|nr:sulfur carrier protein ThiS [Glaciimonas soli]MQR01432.1 sulfur carrier protein ThiS [Glaciimonas soli]
MEIELNGKSFQCIDSQNLAQLVDALELTGKAIAVAVNRQVVQSQYWEQHVLQARDKVDVVRAIGGG